MQWSPSLSDMMKLSYRHASYNMYYMPSLSTTVSCMLFGYTFCHTKVISGIQPSNGFYTMLKPCTYVRTYIPTPSKVAGLSTPRSEYSQCPLLTEIINYKKLHFLNFPLCGPIIQNLMRAENGNFLFIHFAAPSLCRPGRPHHSPCHSPKPLYADIHTDM